MLHGLAATYGTTGVPLLAYWVFQYAFADTCSTVTSGAMIGRCGFHRRPALQRRRDRLHLPDHRPLGVGSGRLAGGHGADRFHDFAGSTVVHTIGGAISLAGAIALGPRLGRVFKRDGGQPMKPHDLIIGAIGGLILWFGWYGFNPGSTLSALDAQGIGRVSFNTTMAACSAGLTALFYSYFKSRQVGSRADGQRLPGRTGRDHLSLLLGRSRRRVLHRHRRGHRRDLGHRPARIPAHRRSDRRGSGAHDRGHLGHALARPVRRRQVRCADADGRRHQQRRHRPVLRRRHGRPESADDRQLLDHDRDLRCLDGADVRGQSHRHRCASRPKARSKDSTCTSMASRHTRSTLLPATTGAPRPSTTYQLGRRTLARPSKAKKVA